MENPIEVQIDPLALEGIQNLMNPKTFDVYKKSWMDFINFAGVSILRKPDEEDFRRYLEKKRDAGLCGNSISSIYSHLNKFFIQLYGERLGVSAKQEPINP